MLGLIGESKKCQKMPWCKMRHGLFELMVIVGVAGELLADGGIFLSSGHLQNITDLEIENLQTTNASLVKIAGEAHLSAALTESNNLVLSSNVFALARVYDQSTNALAEARVRLKDATSLLVQTKAELSAAKDKIEDISKATARTEKKIAPRRLNEEQQAAMFRAIPDFEAAKFVFRLDPAANDAVGIAEDLRGVLARRGFKYLGADTAQWLGTPSIRGIGVRVNGETNSPIADTIIRQLKAAEIDANPLPIERGPTTRMGFDGMPANAFFEKGIIFIEIGIR